MPADKIIDRVRKLLELSHSTNEHEAAQAAARAAELMSQHDVTAAMLQVTKDEPAPYISERIVKEATPDATGRRVAWRDIISRAVAHSLDCQTYIYTNPDDPTSKCMHAMGRESHVQAWRYMAQYLFNEVERLADAAWMENGADLAAVGQLPRPWKGAFRVGAADVIAARLYEAKQERNAKEKAQATAEAKLLGDGANEQLALVRVENALEVVRKDRQEVVDSFEKMTKGWKRTSAGGGSQRARSGYSAGKEAGSTVNLNGGGKALRSGS